MFNRATRLLEAGRYSRAAQLFREQLKTHSFKELYLNLGNCYRYLDQDSQALECYLQAAAGDMPFASGEYGNYPSALNNIGLLEYARNQLDTAKDFYRAALAIDPLYGECVWNLGNCLLKESNSVVGWDLYEYRFNRGAGSVRLDRSIPRWDGKVSGQSICVLTEQGTGDKIMFGRYLRLLAEHFAEVIVCCHSSLDCLFKEYRCVRTPEGEYSIPMGSLPRMFGVIEVSNYLSGQAHDFGPGRHIGIVASGSQTHANDHNRSIPVGQFVRFAKYGRLYGLNPGDQKHKQVAALNPESWQQTIDYVLGLDLVVTVDTSIVHLAGTLGIPCIMMQPSRDTDFRWGLPGVQNPWYRSVFVVDNYNSWPSTLDSCEKLVALC
jgi:hypothetical protein